MELKKEIRIALAGHTWLDLTNNKYLGDAGYLINYINGNKIKVLNEDVFKGKDLFWYNKIEAASNPEIAKQFEEKKKQHDFEIKQLTEILRKETQSLKKQYLDFTGGYAERSFKFMTEALGWSEEKWFDRYNVKYEYHTACTTGRKYASPVTDEYKKKNYYRLKSDREKYSNIVKIGYDKFLEKEIKFAEAHYENSLIKLASRIIVKELDWTKLTVETAHVDVNITITLTDGVKTVKAFTIIAQGPVQRPHYRYLVK